MTPAEEFWAAYNHQYYVDLYNQHHGLDPATTYDKTPVIGVDSPNDVDYWFTAPDGQIVGDPTNPTALEYQQFLINSQNNGVEPVKQLPTPVAQQPKKSGGLLWLGVGALILAIL